MDIALEDRLRGTTIHEDKVIYIVMFEEGRYLKDRIEKLCASFLEPLYLSFLLIYKYNRFEIRFNEIATELATARRQKDDIKSLIK